MSQNPNLFPYIGKEIRDEYGRVIGKIASFALTPSGKFDTVFIEQGDGRFFKRPVEYLKIDDNNVVLVSKIKSKTNVLCDQIPLIWRKNQALKELLEKKKISQELYTELHSSFDGALNQLKSEAQAILEDIDKEIARCNNEISQLNYALVHLEIEHEIGKIDDENYRTAFELIQENLKRVNSEKADIELMKNKLSNIILGETPEPEIEEIKPLPSSSDSTPELPEPPVVVYVKEIGKANI